MERRSFMKIAGAAAFGTLAGEGCPTRREGTPSRPAAAGEASAPDLADPAAIFLCGDVMTGRGIDQVLPHPGDPRLHERAVRSARRYVALAEQRHGRIPRPVEFSYPWGDALEVLERFAPHARIVNLETAVTTSDQAWPGKGIHYRMHPTNGPCLTAAGIDCCVLANNHVLDWGRPGLEETLDTLQQAKLRVCGAGRDLESAAAPAVLPARGKGRVLVFGLGHSSSGIPEDWAAGPDRPGLHLVDELSEGGAERFAERVAAVKRPGDIAVASIHWGGNWGYRVPAEQRRFAHALVDRAGIDVVHGHSSHHPKGIEVYRQRPVLYGCGDFLNDYEGIGGYETFRGDLTLMYFVRLDGASGRLLALEMVPLRMRRFRLERASSAEARWLAGTLDRHSRALGCGVELPGDETLRLRWAGRS